MCRCVSLGFLTCSHTCLISPEESPQQVRAIHIRDAKNSLVPDSAVKYMAWMQRSVFYFLCCICMFCVAEQKTENDLHKLRWESYINPSVLHSCILKQEMYFLAPSSTFGSIFWHLKKKRKDLAILYFIQDQETWERKKIGPSFHDNPSST